MTQEHPQRRSDAEAEELAESKPDEEREEEQQWSQGGQDVEEAQHEEPEAGQ